MKTLRKMLPLLALALIPALFAQDNPPTTIPPLTGDLITGYRLQANGTNTRSTFALWQLEQLFPPVAGPGILVTPVGNNSGLFNVSLQLINSPSTALGYYTGVGAGQTVTQLTNKSTAVIMPAPCFTGTITMNNASLANGALVKFTVTDGAVATTDIVHVNCQSGSITAASGYMFSTNSGNGTFVVNVYNAGTTESDAIVLNFLVERCSGN